MMVYHVTRRPFWNVARGGVRFAGTTVLLGLAATLFCLAWTEPGSGVRALWVGLAVVALVKLGAESETLDHREDDDGPLRRSVLLLRGPLAGPAMLRVVLGLVGGVVLPLTLAGLGSDATPSVARSMALIAFACLIAGELAERTLFFSAVSRPRMPGGLHS